MFRALILLLALSAGGIAAWLALSLQSGAATAAIEMRPVPTVDILVASEDLSQGRALSDDNIRWQAWPEELVHEAFITRSNEPDAIATHEGAVVRNQLVAGEPVRQDKLVRTASGFLATILPPGKRAMAVRVTAENAAGGFILPNDRVDVIQTISRQTNSGETENFSVTLLTNIRVLAIDQSADETSESSSSSSIIGKTATLELEPRQAEIISAGEASGMLLLALRSSADDADQQQERHPSGVVRVFRAGQSEIVQVH